MARQGVVLLCLVVAAWAAQEGVQLQDLASEEAKQCGVVRTCCTGAAGRLQACNFPNGVCCNGADFCCPAGHTCSTGVGKASCTPAGAANPLAAKIAAKAVAKVAALKKGPSGAVMKELNVMKQQMASMKAMEQALTGGKLSGVSAFKKPSTAGAFKAKNNILSKMASIGVGQKRKRKEAKLLKAMAAANVAASSPLGVAGATPIAPVAQARSNGIMTKLANKMSRSLEKAFSKAAEKVSTRKSRKSRRRGRGGKSGCGRRCRAKLQKRINAVNSKIAAEKAKKAAAAGAGADGLHAKLDSMIKDQLKDNTDWDHKIANEKLSVEQRKAEADLAEARVERMQAELAAQNGRAESFKAGFEAQDSSDSSDSSDASSASARRASAHRRRQRRERRDRRRGDASYKQGRGSRRSSARGYKRGGAVNGAPSQGRYSGAGGRYNRGPNGRGQFKRRQNGGGRNFNGNGQGGFRSGGGRFNQGAGNVNQRKLGGRLARKQNAKINAKRGFFGRAGGRRGGVSRKVAPGAPGSRKAAAAGSLPGAVANLKAIQDAIKAATKQAKATIAQLQSQTKAARAAGGAAKRPLGKAAKAANKKGGPGAKRSKSAKAKAKAARIAKKLQKAAKKQQKKAAKVKGAADLPGVGAKLKGADGKTMQIVHHVIVDLHQQGEDSDD